MSRVKWVLVVALVLGSSPVWAGEDVIPIADPFETRIVPAVLHLPGPGEAPLYSSIQFAKAPPILPTNRCEAQCLASFLEREAECRNMIYLNPCGFLLDLCAADCTDGV
jgi:hypothetical protein